MSYPMVHLSVAWALLPDARAAEPADYMLGAVAPDAVHYRADYNSDMKLYSHFGCESMDKIREKWGYVTENEPWIARVRALWKSCGEGPERSFLCGYYVHILTDIFNNIAVWTPFRMSQGGTFDRTVYNLYGDECRNVDYLLYRNDPERARLWELLGQARAFGIGDHIAKEEVESLRESILHERFRERPLPDVSGNRYFRLEDAQDFIRRAAAFTAERLF